MSTMQQYHTMESEREEQAEDILSQYLDLYSYDCNLFKFYFATNGGLDWFGRTIRNNGKIHEFLRTEVCFAYEHLHFRKAEFCNPVEYKPSHFKTQEIPKETYVPTETGKLFKKPSLKFYADSDIEKDKNDKIEKDFEDEDGITVLDAESSNYYLRNVSTPPPSASSSNSIDIYCDVNYEPTAPKRRKKSLFSNQVTEIDKIDCGKEAVVAVATPLPKTTTTTTTDDNSTKFSSLKYIEAIGTLRSIFHTKHRGVGGSRFSTSSTSNQSLEFSDREVRIKISYRIRSDDDDNQIQFALVIYENLQQSSRISRRNLMNEFCKVAEDGVTTSNALTEKDDSNDVCMFRSPPSTPSRTPKRQTAESTSLKAAAESKNGKQKTVRSLRFF